MQKVILGLTLLLLVGMLITGCNGKGADKYFDIMIENANDVGSLQTTLSYDASIIEITEVKAGKLGKNALLEFSKDTAGFLVIGIVDSAGINGSGPIASVSYKMLQKDMVCPLRIKEAQAYNADNLIDIAVKLADGMIIKEEISEPSISFR
jgi:hypothetical protein